MPRTARQKSETGIYHIVLRGINRQDIFYDDEDRRKYLSILTECRHICAFELYAYCLMDNHIHLLMKVGSAPLETIFKRIGCRFVYWYNLKYQRTGPLFQGRFYSEPVEDDAYFLAVLRYIHQNPVKAGLSAEPGGYRWSSYFSYAGWPDGLTDTSFATKMFLSRDALIAYLHQEGSDLVPDAAPVPRTGLTDEEASAVLAEVCGAANASGFQNLRRPLQEAYIRELTARGLTLRQVARLTGIPGTSIRRMRSAP